MPSPITALIRKPRRFALHHAEAFGLDIAELPLPQPESPIYALAPRAAMADRAIAWLMDQLMVDGEVRAFPKSER